MIVPALILSPVVVSVLTLVALITIVLISSVILVLIAISGIVLHLSKFLSHPPWRFFVSQTAGHNQYGQTEGILYRAIYFESIYL